eukprot:jgi/Mesen1/944/ME000118S00121
MRNPPLRRLVNAALAPHMLELLQLLPRKVGMPPFNVGFQACLGHIEQQLRPILTHPMMPAVIASLREIGSLLAFFSLLDIALRDVGTVQFMQSAPFLGIVPGSNGQLQQIPAETDGNSPAGPLAPLSDLLQRAAASSPSLGPPLMGVLQGAQVAEAMYWSGVQAESLLGHALKHLSAAIEHLRYLWSAPPTPSSDHGMSTKEYHRIFSAIQYRLCLEEVTSAAAGAAGGEGEQYSDAVAWGGCALLALLGQRRRFELTNATYHLLLLAEHDEATRPPGEPLLQQEAPLAGPGEKGGARKDLSEQELKALLVRAKRAKWQNEHALSLVGAHLPEKPRAAAVITPSGDVTNGSYPLPVSSFYVPSAPLPNASKPIYSGGEGVSTA